MAIKFQYNKVSLQEMQKQLKARTDALPVLTYKESILRAETEKARKKMIALEQEIDQTMQRYDYLDTLWQEFPLNLLSVSEIKTSQTNIAGVKIPRFEEVLFDTAPLCLFNYPLWIADGIAILTNLVRLSIEKQIAQTSAGLLDAARKKTTQKVNLYEKVQVPAYLQAISKVKKYMDDAESLGKAGQKIMKKRISSIINQQP